MINNFKATVFYFFILWLFGQSCANAPDFSDIPNLSFTGLSKFELIQSSFNSDTLILFLEFEDGDGDIGRMDSDFMTDLFIIDKRLNDTIDRIKTPFVPLQGAANGIRGTMQIQLFTTCCIFPDGIPPCQNPPQYPTNDLQYDIFLIDRAGNQSNTVTTDVITLLCN